VWLDVKAIRTNPKYSIAFMTKHGLTEEFQGFYLMRNERQVGAAQSFGPHGLFVRNADLNYFRGEISFPPEADHLFGIQQNKSRFSLKGDFKERLRTELGTLIRDIKRKTREFIRELLKERAKAAQQAGPTVAEQTMAKAARLLKRPKRPAGGSREAEQKLAVKVAELEQELEAVRSDATLPEEQRQERVAQVEGAIKKAKLGFVISSKVIGCGCFYHVDRLGTHVEVILNEGHEFYGFFVKQQKDPSHRTLLELMLLTAAYGESVFEIGGDEDGAHMSKAIESFRREWSTGLAMVLDQLKNDTPETAVPDNDGDDEDDVSTAARESEGAVGAPRRRGRPRKA
jgi:hypothetical protein